MPRKYAGIERPKKQYQYETLEQCEEAGNHEIHPTSWPPSKTTSNPDGTMSAQCVKCGAHCIVTAANVAEQTGIDIVEPKRVKQPA